MDDAMETNDESAEPGDLEAEPPAVDSVDARLSDFDYLVTMQLIKLSEEEKDKLLRERDIKDTELKTLEGKSWKDLWIEDLDAFLVALEVCEIWDF